MSARPDRVVALLEVDRDHVAEHVHRGDLARGEQLPGELADGVVPTASSIDVNRSWPMPDSDRLSSKRTTPGVALGFSTTPTSCPIAAEKLARPCRPASRHRTRSGHERAASTSGKRSGVHAITVAPGGDEVGGHRPVVHRRALVAQRQQRQHGARPSA